MPELLNEAFSAKATHLKRHKQPYDTSLEKYERDM